MSNKIKELLKVLLAQADKLDLHKVNTNYIEYDFEQRFLEKAISLYKKEGIGTTSVGGIETDYCIFFSKEGIIYFLKFDTWETHPEGPNNEPPGVQDGWDIRWCTKTSELKTIESTLNIPHNFFNAWDKIKMEAEDSLKENKRVEFI